MTIIPRMPHLLPEVRQYYAEVGVILENFLDEDGSELVRQVLERLSVRPPEVQVLVEHEDPFQVAIQVAKNPHDDWVDGARRYQSYRRTRDTKDWRHAVEAFDQKYLTRFISAPTDPDVLGYAFKVSDFEALRAINNRLYDSRGLSISERRDLATQMWAILQRAVPGTTT